MYMGHDGIYSDHSTYVKKNNCEVCLVPKIMKVERTMLLKDFLSQLEKNYSLKSPGILYNGDYIYVSSPVEIEEPLRDRLSLTFDELIKKEIMINQPYSYALEVFDTSKSFNLRVIF